MKKFYYQLVNQEWGFWYALKLNSKHFRNITEALVVWLLLIKIIKMLRLYKTLYNKHVHFHLTDNF